MNTLLLNYKKLQGNAGIDGLDPIAKQFMNIGLEGMAITPVAFERNLYTYSNEAISGDDIIEFLKKLLDRVLSSLSEWRVAFVRYLDNLCGIIRTKYEEWEIGNVPFNDFEPFTVSLDNVHLFNTKGCILKSGKTYQSTDLVPGNNYRKFQIANGVMSLTSFGLGVPEMVANEDDATSKYLVDLIDELGELIQPDHDSNYGGWGLVNYDASTIQSLKGKSFEEVHDSLMEIKFTIVPPSTGTEITFDDPSVILDSIKSARKQLDVIEKILKDYTYIDSLETRLTKAKAKLSSLRDTDLSTIGRHILTEFNLCVAMYKHYCKVNRDMMTGLVKTVIAVGDTHMGAYRKAKGR